MAIKDFTKDNLRVRIFHSSREMGECASREISKQITELLKKKKTLNMLFAAAPSQNEILSALQKEKGIDWSKINAFQMDEYIGLNSNHKALLGTYLKNTIFDHQDFRSVNLINASAPNPASEAARYASIIKDNPIDICLLGIGENGHLAFNDPHSANFEDPETVKVVTLDEVCRTQQVHDGCFADFKDVPTQAITLTIPALLSASYIFCTVPGSSKAEAIKAMISRNISTWTPASILRRHPNANLYADRLAAWIILHGY